MDDEKIVPDLEVRGVKIKKTQKELSDTPIEPVAASDEKEVSETDTDSDDQSDTNSDSDSEYECRVCQRKISGYLSFKRHQKGRKHMKALLKKKKEKKILEKDANSENEDDEEHLIQEPYAVCKVCDKQFTGPESYQNHLQSKKHKRKLHDASILEQVLEKGEINADKLKELIKSKRMTTDVPEIDKEQMASLKMEDDDEASPKEYECKECEKEFSGLKPFTEHLLSKSHTKKVEKRELLHKLVPDKSDQIVGEIKEDIRTLIMDDDILVCKLCTTSLSGPENARLHLKSKKHLKNLDKYVRKLDKKKKKNSELRLDEKAREGTLEDKNSDKATKQELQLATDPSAKLEISENSEKQESSAPGENDNELICYENYKKYKDLMNSLPQKDRIL